ncbi:sensor histidine kinase [Actinomadura sp. 9N407]|uniref:sensor histidine kinase n=1 Tax=Actinomadura sp. 9N407 TaxID=3375154 RepID=UPI0037A9C2B0
MPTDRPRSPFEAVRRRRFLLSGWPWRAAGYFITGTLVSVPLASLCLLWALAVARSPVLIGLSVVAFIALGPLLALPLADLERGRLRMVDGRALRSGHRAASKRWSKARYTEAATWREFGYACLFIAVTPVLATMLALALFWMLTALVSPFILLGDTGHVALGMSNVSTSGDALPYALAAGVLLVAIPYLMALLAGLHALTVRTLLGPGSSEHLRAELVEVARSRARLVDAFQTERRRIERDLHDGAQQSLIGLTLQIGLARLDVPPGSAAAERIGAAHHQAKRLMVELRELIHGIHPQVLTDRGLPAALGELADRSAFPVTIDAELPVRPPGSVETTAYFVVAEALANAAKHSGGTRAAVTVRLDDGLLAVQVEDDGNGGADPERGTGLTGLADRVAVIDGRMFLSSPSGGPTLLRVELSCDPIDPTRPSG